MGKISISKVNKELSNCRLSAKVDSTYLKLIQDMENKEYLILRTKEILEYIELEYNILKDARNRLNKFEVLQANDRLDNKIAMAIQTLALLKARMK